MVFPVLSTSEKVVEFQLKVEHGCDSELFYDSLVYVSPSLD